MRLLTILAVIGTAGLTLALPHAVGAQQPPSAGAPVSAALRAYVREMYPKLILAAEAMPADKYTRRASATSPRTFGESVWLLGDYGRDICGRLAKVPGPWGRRPELTPESPKDSLVGRLRDDARFCESAFARLDDTQLADSVYLEVRNAPVGMTPRMPQAMAVIQATAFFADLYARLTEALRFNGIVPPKPSGVSTSDPDPGSGRLMCTDARPQRRGERWGGPGYVFTLSDATRQTPYTVTSDGRGPYLHGTSNVDLIAASRAAVLHMAGPSVNGAPRRAIRVDLSQPVPGGGGTPLGVVTDSSHLEVAAQWKAEPDGAHRRAYNMHDIPVGTTVEAAQLDVQFHIDGVVHALQAGPQPIGHCYSDPPAISGQGTSRATISRPDSATWIVELPPGSVGRLYDVSLSYPHAKDRGLYRVALRFVVKRQ